MSGTIVTGASVNTVLSVRRTRWEGEMIALILQLRLLGTTVNDDYLLRTRCPFVFTSSTGRFADELHSRLMRDSLRAISTGRLFRFSCGGLQWRGHDVIKHIMKAPTSHIQLDILRIVKISRELCCLSVLTSVKRIWMISFGLRTRTHTTNFFELKLFS